MEILWVVNSIVLWVVAIVILLTIRQYSINNTTRTSLEVLSSSMNLPDILSVIIDESFSDYMALNLAYKEAGHINSTEEKEIVSKVTEYVVKRLSPSIQMVLMGYYNADSIDKVIADKVFIAVTAYVVENNSSFTSYNDKLDDEAKDRTEV